ncbi:Hypothetical protein SMAX5B_010251 [Scophthalmus maximus]|uniref:Uncharacterized protein n=1 Tax=Scophthalmus maximus TaxID=52904 RepID=A0A2U9CCZ6_SCOMX|nr:Hypothetical protein SMAX5B_010251 [Scophthalmus maximus]
MKLCSSNGLKWRSDLLDNTETLRALELREPQVEEVNPTLMNGRWLNHSLVIVSVEKKRKGADGRQLMKRGGGRVVKYWICDCGSSLSSVMR